MLERRASLFSKASLLPLEITAISSSAGGTNKKITRADCYDCLKQGKYDLDFTIAASGIGGQESSYLQKEELSIYDFLKSKGIAPVQVGEFFEDIRKSDNTASSITDDPQVLEKNCSTQTACEAVNKSVQKASDMPTLIIPKKKLSSQEF